VSGRAPRLSLALATVAICPAVLACTGKATQQSNEGASAATACATTRYVLTAHPTTIVSNEYHRVFVRALADSCGHQAAVRGADVRLHGYGATTGPRGRCVLDVRLPTGHYLVRLYVHGHPVASTAVSAIPVVTR
jgi:hypothetical protein